MTNILAQDANFGTFKGFGPLGLEGKNASSAIGIFGGIISSAVGLMTIVAIIWFVFVFMSGAIGIIASGGDKQALEGARKKITTGIIGLVVVISVIFVAGLVGTLLGIPDFLNIPVLFSKILPAK